MIATLNVGFLGSFDVTRSESLNDNGAVGTNSTVTSWESPGASVKTVGLTVNWVSVCRRALCSQS